MNEHAVGWLRLAIQSGVLADSTALVPRRSSCENGNSICANWRLG
jgi:hypothetical protein